MLLLILLTLIYYIIFWGFGGLTNYLYNSNKLISLQLTAGVFVVGIIALISSFLFALNIYYELIIVGIGLGLGIYYRFWNSLKLFDFMSSILTLLICFVGSMSPYLADTFSYYFPTIKWLDDYGLVKGLANFDFNLGQHSLWHIIQACFNETIDKYYKLNTFLVFIFVLFLKEVRLQQFLLFVPLFFLFILSPSSDLPIFIFSLISVILYFKIGDDQSKKIGLIIGAFLVLIKPISITLPLFYFCITIRRFLIYKKEYLIVAGLGILFFLKNSIISGNIMFPLSLGNLKFLDHSLPEVRYTLSSIDGRYLLTSVENPVDYYYFSSWSTSEYLYYLSTNLTFSLLIYIFISIFSLFFVLYSFIKSQFKLLSILILLKCLLFIVVSMQYRFLIDILLIMIVVLFLNFKVKLRLILPFCILSSLFFVFFKDININNSLYFLNGVSKYHPKQILSPFNYRVKSESVTLFNQDSRIINNYIFSLDHPQPVYNVNLLEKYSFEGFHPELIDSTNISKGFKSVKNDSVDIKEIDRLYKKIHNMNSK